MTSNDSSPCFGDYADSTTEFAAVQAASIGVLTALSGTQATDSTDVIDLRPPSAARGRHRGHPAKRAGYARQSAAAVLVGAVAFIAFWALTLPGARWIIYLAWMMPVIELAMLTAGHIAYRRRFRAAPEDWFRHLIIQITTTGAEQARVNEIIGQIRGYRLKMDCQIWVVTEPGRNHDYPFADRVIVVPASFAVRSSSKARALEFSRQVRESLGLNRADVKIIFNDDDVTLTQAYIERAFEAAYDICEGVVSPRTAYAVRPAGHFLASHADDIRTHACLAYCSVFQGILHRPIHVHGEGLVVTGAAEWLVTWDWPVFASEDLVFGQRAAAAGLRWGWFHEYAEVTSPWTVRDYLTQRRRWLWGDIHAVTHRGVLPASGRALVTGKYLVGVTVLLASAAGLYLRASGGIPSTAGALDWAKLSVLAWLGVFFACGWIGASTANPARSSDSRMLAGVTAVVMMPASLLLTLAAIVVPLIEGNPRSFRVITKTRGTA